MNLDGTGHLRPPPPVPPPRLKEARRMVLATSLPPLEPVVLPPPGPPRPPGPPGPPRPDPPSAVPPRAQRLWPLSGITNCIFSVTPEAISVRNPSVMPVVTGIRLVVD